MGGAFDLGVARSSVGVLSQLTGGSQALPHAGATWRVAWGALKNPALEFWGGDPRMWVFDKSPWWGVVCQD